MGTNSSPVFPYPGGVAGAEPQDPQVGKPGHFAWSRWIKQFVKNLNTNLMVHQDAADPHPQYLLLDEAGTGSVYVQADNPVSEGDWMWVNIADTSGGGGGGGAPSGPAGGDLEGTYPNPQIAAGVIVNADINSAAAIAQSKISGLPAALTGKVTNVQGVAGIWTGTQAAYDAIGTKDPATLYVIV